MLSNFLQRRAIKQCQSSVLNDSTAQHAFIDCLHSINTARDSSCPETTLLVTLIFSAKKY